MTPTPGPWKIANLTDEQRPRFPLDPPFKGTFDCVVVGSTNGGVVAYVPNKGDLSQAIETGRLVALAPELLSALREMLRIVTPDGQGLAGTSVEDREKVVELANRLIKG